jgi:molybdopterin-containing oxidoreductase family membrane subunit
MKTFFAFVLDGAKCAFRGSPLYYAWMGILLVLIGITIYSYSQQWIHGLVITGLSDQVSWGFYIANFVFFVGIAAAGVLLTVPAYIFHRQDVKTVVVIGEAMAFSAVIVSMGYVAVDIGRLDRAWHVIPYIGIFNWPASILAWDIVVLSGYLLLNLFIPMYILFKHYQGKEAPVRKYFFWVVVTCFWAISIHTVTAWLLSSNVARPFWNTALMAPRFISSAFTAGPALMIIILLVIRRSTSYPVSKSVINMLAVIMAIALQISLYFVAAELFTDFYFEGAHAASIHYLFLGLDGFDGLKAWIWSAMVLNLVALVLLMVHKTRTNMTTLVIACVLAFVGIWIEKGMGLVVPGFIPTPLGEIFEYTPTLLEIGVSVGIFALGAFVFTVLAKIAINIELGRIGERKCMGGESIQSDDGDDREAASVRV